MLQRIRTSLQRTTDHAKDRGASAVEYGLMVAAIAAVIVGAVFGLGTFVKGAFDDTCTAISKPAQKGCEAPKTP